MQVGWRRRLPVLAAPTVLRRRGLAVLAAPAVEARWSVGPRPELRERVHRLVADTGHGAPGLGEGLKPVALRCIEAGEIVFQEGGEYVSSPGLHTIQVGVDVHLHMPGEARYTAHSFSPTCYCRIVEPSAHPIDIVALRRIGVGQEISFDYTTVEWELAGGGFVDAATGRWCRGFKHRMEEEKRVLLASSVLPRHIMALWLADMLGKDRERN
mmetsp:Transcript_24900/g.80460  ORF Transcript_24900/g.80460 Transcript_24900/m.80460 type:complete len:212 (-) Transcript_24900:259-894(-)